MKTLADLQAIRDRKRADLENRNSTGAKMRVVVGMATCGIAAGARPVMTALVEEVARRSLFDVQVVQSGCIGMCTLEPIVEVFDQTGEKTTYVHVTADKAVRIVAEHIAGGRPIVEFMLNSAKEGL
ncbi:MAG: (2Fe-2S) ferredoxin domain-containing protein [Clostridiales bacterium]|jgi:NADP-reducing hydrogenase subunit HndB|nr:(2Fe-2S) ferredoxin domain-containing protein [Clostridiales bacterium]